VLPGTADAWLKAAQQHAGSWWVDWKEWIAQHGGGKVPARVPGKGGLKALEDAPGSFVRVRGDAKLASAPRRKEAEAQGRA